MPGRYAPGMDVRVGERAEPTTCAYCRGPLADRGAAPCGACGVVLHDDCRAQNGGRCTTLGCAAAPVETPAAAPAPACAYCRGPLGDARGVSPCGRCGVVLHDDCRAENGGRCTTLGCAPRKGRLARLLDSPWSWPALVPALVLEANVGRAGRWVHLAATLAVLVLALRAVARDAALRTAAVVCGAGLLAVFAVGLDLRSLRWLPDHAMDWYLGLPVLSGLAVLALVLGAGLVGRRATAKERTGDVPVGGLCVLLFLVWGGLFLARRDAWAQWVADARATWALRFGDAEAALPVFLDHTRRDDRVREAAYRAFSTLDRPDLQASFVQWLSGPDTWLRYSAAAALAQNRTKDPGLVPTIVARLDAEAVPEVRTALAGLASAYAQEYPAEMRAALPALVQLLRDDDPWTRVNAIEALGALDDPAAVVPHLVPHLTRRLSDDSMGGDWRRPDLLAARTLAGQGEAGRAALREAAASHPDPDVRARAASLLDVR